MAQPLAPTTSKEIPEGLPATFRPLGALPAEERQDRYWSAVALMVVLLLAIAAGGTWTYTQVRASLEDIRFAGLESLLEAQSGGMMIWIDEKKRDAERWASTPDVQRAAAELVRLSRQGANPAEVCASSPRRVLMEEIAPYAVLEEAVAFNLTLPDGTIVASNDQGYCGQRIDAKEFLQRIAPAFEGRTVFIRPFLERERVNASAAASFERPLVWVETPVRDEGGKVIAALGFGRVADERFGKLLTSNTSRTSREAYAFDRRGRILTQSRYLGDLRGAGLLGPGDNGILTFELREPPGELTGPLPAGTSWRELPLTRIVQEALSGHGEGVERGALVEPYRNYRGAMVIGAWRWLPEKEMAVAVEIETAEAFAPLQYVQVAFVGLFIFLLVSLLAAGASSIWAVRLRLQEARRVGQYTIEREIGEGGMSRVYLARHSHLKRPTAVKVLKMALASDEVVTRFEREVQVCSQLSHPNTIEIYDYGRTRDGTFYYAMEYLRGISLEDLVRREGPMPVARAVHALRQVCGSLREAHQHGLVHRDVKPQNLMLCVRGAQHDVVKVLDFGLVKEIHNPHTRDITQFAKVLGTPLYMAPERLRNPADADARADIYALGAVAYFIVTGSHAFKAETDHDLVYRILNDPAPTLAHGGARDVPAELEALVARCLRKDREERPRDIEEVSAVLAGIARNHPWSERDARRWWEERAGALGIDLAPGS
ncbi:MAG TPA: protein kinase [Usitatibacter sp.]|nr:protein kinase [Usitatibacter sp.]